MTPLRHRDVCRAVDWTQLTIRLRPATHAKIEALAGRERRSMAQQVEYLIERAAAGLPAARQPDLKGARSAPPAKPALR